jgi:hypothetical protein
VGQTKYEELAETIAARVRESGAAAVTPGALEEFRAHPLFLSLYGSLSSVYDLPDRTLTRLIAAAQRVL